MLHLVKNKNELLAFGHVGTIGLEMGLSVLFGLLGGQWLDGQFETAPMFETAGFILGLVAGLRSLYQLARRTRRDLAREMEADLAQSGSRTEHTQEQLPHQP